MKRLKKHTRGFLIGMLAATLVYLAILAVSWICACGIYAFLCLCFEWEFSWGIGTGLWICWYILKSIFNVTIRNRD